VHDSVTSLIGEIEPGMNGQPVTIAGMLTAIRTIVTKKGDTMAFCRLEDLQGAIELTVFPRTYLEVKPLLKLDAMLLVAGKVESRDERLQVIADLVRAFDPETRLTPGPGERAAASESGLASASDPPVDQMPAAAEPPVGSAWAEQTDMDDLLPYAEPPPPTDREPAREAANSTPRLAPPLAPAAPTAPTSQEKAQESAPPPTLEPVLNDRAEERAPNGRGGAPYRLTVQVPRSADHEADIRLLGQVYQILTSYQGQDRFSLRVRNGQGMVDLEFPNDQTRYCVGLMKALESLVGSGHVGVNAPQAPKEPRGGARRGGGPNPRP